MIDGNSNSTNNMTLKHLVRSYKVQFSFFFLFFGEKGLTGGFRSRSNQGFCFFNVAADEENQMIDVRSVLKGFSSC